MTATRRRASPTAQLVPSAGRPRRGDHRTQGRSQRASTVSTLVIDAGTDARTAGGHTGAAATRGPAADRTDGHARPTDARSPGTPRTCHASARRPAPRPTAHDRSRARVRTGRRRSRRGCHARGSRVMGERYLPAPGSSRPSGADGGDVAPGGAARRCAGAACRRLRGGGAGESSISVSLPSLRGGIYARDGSPLALSVPTDDVVADDYQVAHPVETALALSPILHVPATTLASAAASAVGLRGPGPPAPPVDRPEDLGGRLSRHHDDRRFEAGGAQREPGGTGRRVHQRGRPRRRGTRVRGQPAAGGTDGKETIMESPAGVALPQSPVTNQVATTPGTGLELTLDTQLQYESEQALAKAIESSNAVSGTAVVMDVKTGQILSMANLVANHPGAIGSPSATEPFGARGCGADRAERRGRRGSEQPRGQPALRTGLGVQARHLLGGAAGRPDQPQLASPCPTRSSWTDPPSTTPSPTPPRRSPRRRSWPSRPTSARRRSRRVSASSGC